MPRADIVILTVIPEEYEAVLACLSSYGCKTDHDPGSSTAPNQFGWVTGELPGANDQVYRIVVGIVVQPGPGRMASAVSATYARYKPQYVLIVGIAGGFPQDRLTKGDVAISSVIYDYDYGKVATDFQPRMDFTYQPDQTLLTSAVSLHARDKSWAAKDLNLRPDGGDVVPKVLPGAVASGGKVVDDASNAFFAEVLKAWPKLLAVEMEGAGAAAAIETAKAAKQNVGFLMVRGISDMPKMGEGNQPAAVPPEGNKAERDSWKKYAATTAANFTIHWISRAWPLAPRPTRRSGSSAPSEEADDDDPPGPSQHASIGNMTGSNTVTINQTQGLSVEDLARLMHASAPDANAEIDAACAHMAAGDVGITIHLLTEMRRKRWDRLTPREKYRVKANLGQALERKGEFREAAKHYIEAKHYQPLDDSARALEAIAYYHLDDKPKAYAIAGDIIRDHPTCSLAIAARIHSAPSDVSLPDLEGSVPEALREDLEILHALGSRALRSGDISAAERIASTALKCHPDSVVLKEHQAAVIVQIESRAKLTNKPVNKERLQQAIAVLSAGIAKQRGRQDETRLRYWRAEAYDLMGKTEDAETDFRAAIDADKGEPDIVRRFALLLERHDRLDAAIDALQQADKINQNHTNRLMLACLLGERKGHGDWELAMKLLRESITQIPEAETRAGMVATLTRLLGLLKRDDEAISYLDGLGADFLRPPVVATIRSLVLNRAGRKDEAVACARQALQSLEVDSPETDRMRVAEVLGFVGEKQDALTQWKKVLRPDRADPFVCTALELARQTGDDNFIISFGKQLRAAGVTHPFTMQLEVETREKYRMFDEAIAVMSDYLATSPDDDLARVFRVRLSLLGIRLDRPELIEKDMDKLPPVETAPVKIGAATAYVLKHGPHPEKGVGYAYELVRRHFDDPLAWQAYFGTIGAGDESSGLFPAPPTVAPGCAVKYKPDDNDEEKWIIIEDATNPCFEREEISPGHPWAAEMLDQPVGGRFHLRRDPIQPRMATIRGIISKFVYRKLEILDGWEERFPEQPFARKYTFPTKDDGSPDITLILKALDLQEQQIEQIHALYRANPISATTFARFANVGVLESLSHLASEGTLPVRCCRGTTEELERAEAALAAAGTIVVESSALATLFFSGQYKQLEHLQGKIVIFESALEEYTELRRKFASSARGFVGKFKGQYLFQEDDPAERQRQEQRLHTFLTKIRPLVTIKSGESLAGLSRERREELIGLFGQPTAEAIAEAAASGAILWTDDIAVAEVAREVAGVKKRVWTQMVFRSVATLDVYTDLTLFLLQWRYFFTRVEPEVVLAACRVSCWDPNAPVLRRIVEWLSMPELLPLGAAQACAHSLRLIWKQAIDIGQKQGVAQALLRAVLGRQGGRQTVISLGNNLDAIFEGDKVARRQCAPVIQEVLKVEPKPANDASRAAWAKILPKFERKAALSGARNPEEPTPNGGGATRASDPTPKERAERRKAARKRKKGRG